MPFIYHVNLGIRDPKVYPTPPKRDSPRPGTPSTKLGDVYRDNPELKLEEDKWRFSKRVPVQNGDHEVGNTFWTKPWELGKIGKGILMPNGLHLWSADPDSGETKNDPHHDIMFKSLYDGPDDPKSYFGTMDSTPKFYIGRDGQLNGRILGEKDDLDAIAAMHPDLKAPFVKDDNLWTFDKTAKIVENTWQRAKWGKGIIFNGDAWFWAVDRKGAPHHSDFLAGEGLDTLRDGIPLLVKPDGTVDIYKYPTADDSSRVENQLELFGDQWPRYMKPGNIGNFYHNNKLDPFSLPETGDWLFAQANINHGAVDTSSSSRECNQNTALTFQSARDSDDWWAKNDPEGKWRPQPKQTAITPATLSEHDYESDAIMPSNRRPVLYNSADNHVYVGPHNAHHDGLYEEMGEDWDPSNVVTGIMFKPKGINMPESLRFWKDNNVPYPQAAEDALVKQYGVVPQRDEDEDEWEFTSSVLSNKLVVHKHGDPNRFDPKDFSGWYNEQDNSLDVGDKNMHHPDIPHSENAIAFWSYMGKLETSHDEPHWLDRIAEWLQSQGVITVLENNEWRFAANRITPKNYLRPTGKTPYKGLIMKDGREYRWSLYGPGAWPEMYADRTNHADIMIQEGIDPHDVGKYIDSSAYDHDSWNFGNDLETRDPKYQQQYIDNTIKYRKVRDSSRHFNPTSQVDIASAFASPVDELKTFLKTYDKMPQHAIQGDGQDGQQQEVRSDSGFEDSSDNGRAQLQSVSSIRNSEENAERVTQPHWEKDPNNVWDYDKSKVKPYEPGSGGKFLIDPDGRVYSWNVDAMGGPHHFTYAKDFLNQDHEVGIVPQGWAQGWLNNFGKEVEVEVIGPDHLKEIAYNTFGGEQPKDWTFSKIAVTNDMYKPWELGSDGKFLVSPEGEMHHWKVNPAGSPHHIEYGEDMGMDFGGSAIAPKGWSQGFLSPVGQYSLVPSGFKYPNHNAIVEKELGVEEYNEEDWRFSSSTLKPWENDRIHEGKFLVSPEGEAHAWQTDRGGYPNHAIAAQEIFGPKLKEEYRDKIGNWAHGYIHSDGSYSHSERGEVEDRVDNAAKQLGLIKKEKEGWSFESSSIPSNSSNSHDYPISPNYRQTPTTSHTYSGVTYSNNEPMQGDPTNPYHQSNLEPWKPGKYGKILVYKGKIHSWASISFGPSVKDGKPFHMDYAKANGIPFTPNEWIKGWIEPNGEVSITDTQVLPRIISEIPGTKAKGNSDWTFSKSSKQGLDCSSNPGADLQKPIRGNKRLDKRSASIQPWAKGSDGKWIITPDGKVHHWKDQSIIGGLHHHDYLVMNGLYQKGWTTWPSGEISPDGLIEVVYGSGDKDKAAHTVTEQVKGTYIGQGEAPWTFSNMRERYAHLARRIRVRAALPKAVKGEAVRPIKGWLGWGVVDTQSYEQKMDFRGGLQPDLHQHAKLQKIGINMNREPKGTRPNTQKLYSNSENLWDFTYTASSLALTPPGFTPWKLGLGVSGKALVYNDKIYAWATDANYDKGLELEGAPHHDDARLALGAKWEDIQGDVYINADGGVSEADCEYDLMKLIAKAIGGHVQEEGNWTFSKIAHLLEWTKGNWGRAIYNDDGEIYTWNCGPNERDVWRNEELFHHPYAVENDIPLTLDSVFLYIEPNGVVQDDGYPREQAKVQKLIAPPDLPLMDNDEWRF